MLDLTEIPIAASSRNVYLYAFAALEKWLRGRPITDETLAQYLSYLFDKGKGTQSGEVALKAVRWRFLSEDKDDPRGKLCHRAIASYRRQGVGRGRGQVDGLTFEDVEKMVSLAVQEQTIYGFLDAALFSVMSNGLLRTAEAVAIDVAHLDFAGNVLLIPKSKTDQLGVGASQWISNKTLEHIGAWMEKAKITEGPLFRGIHKTYRRPMKKRIHGNTIRKSIKDRAKAAGIEGRFSGHSFRIGAAQSLAAAGATLVELQIAGRWQSADMVAHYARGVSAQQSCVARILGAAQ